MNLLNIELTNCKNISLNFLAKLKIFINKSNSYKNKMTFRTKFMPLFTFKLIKLLIIFSSKILKKSKILMILETNKMNNKSESQGAPLKINSKIMIGKIL